MYWDRCQKTTVRGSHHYRSEVSVSFPALMRLKSLKMIPLILYHSQRMIWNFTSFHPRNHLLKPNLRCSRDASQLFAKPKKKPQLLPILSMQEHEYLHQAFSKRDGSQPPCPSGVGSACLANNLLNPLLKMRSMTRAGPLAKLVMLTRRTRKR